MMLKPQYGILEFLLGTVAIALILVTYRSWTEKEVVSLLRVPTRDYDVKGWANRWGIPLAERTFQKNRALAANAFTSDESKAATLALIPDSEQPNAARLLSTLNAMYPGDSELLRLSIKGHDTSSCIRILTAHVESTLPTVDANVRPKLVQTAVAIPENTYYQIWMAGIGILIVTLSVGYGRQLWTIWLSNRRHRQIARGLGILPERTGVVLGQDAQATKKAGLELSPALTNRNLPTN